MRALFDKALPIVLNGLGSVAVLVTFCMLAIIVGAVGAFFGFGYAEEHGFPIAVQRVAMVLCAVLAPVWLGIWLWRSIIRPDDEPPSSS